MQWADDPRYKNDDKWQQSKQQYSDVHYIFECTYQEPNNFPYKHEAKPIPLQQSKREITFLKNHSVRKIAAVNHF